MCPTKRCANFARLSIAAPSSRRRGGAAWTRTRSRIPTWRHNLRKRSRVNCPRAGRRICRPSRRPTARWRRATPGARSSTRWRACVTNLVGGSADLDPSTRTAMTGCGDFESPPTPQSDEGLPTQGAAGGVWGYAGRNIHFGLREHAMAAALTGMALHGGLRPFGATFFSFSDYMRPSIRLAALSNAHVIYVWTHDSIALGEDGPDPSARRTVGGSARHAQHVDPAAERRHRNRGGVARRAPAHGRTGRARAHAAEAARAGSRRSLPRHLVSRRARTSSPRPTRRRRR